jgi:Ca2+-binding RTX toxin-like protein
MDVNDTLVGAEGNDTLEGLGGDDLLQGKAGDDSLLGGEGNDTLEGDEGADELFGDAGNDSLMGGSGADTLLGGDGADTLRGGGLDDLDGGLGNDLLLDSYDDFAPYPGVAHTVAGGDGDDTIEGSFGALIDAGAGNDSIRGLYDAVSAGAGNDTILGTLFEESGLIDGGDGFDSYRFPDFSHAGEQSLRNIEEVRLWLNNTLIALPDATVAAGATVSVLGDVINMSYVFSAEAESDGRYLISTLDGNDRLTGGALEDTISSGGGDDTITGGAGNDSIEGGGGFDTAVFSGNRAGYTIDTIDGAVHVSGADGADVLQYVNALQFDDQTVEVEFPGVNQSGTASSETLTGGEGNDTFQGLGGDDLLQGLTGSDSLLGGEGNDTLEGGQGADELFGDAGNDSLMGGSGADTLLGGDGADTLRGGGLDDLDGGLGNDLVVDSYDDFAPYPGVAHTVAGGDGDDTIEGSFGALIDAGAGNDSIRGLYDAVSAGAGNDTILGTLFEESGLIDGGDGFDSYRFPDFSHAGEQSLRNIEEVRLWLNNTLIALPDATVAAGATVSVLGDVINMSYVFSAEAESDGRYLISTLDGNDRLTGGALEDTISSGGGDDTITGGAGNDSIEGGGGFDTAVFSGNRAGYTIDTIDGAVHVSGADGADILLNVNELQFDDQSVAVVVPGLHLVGTSAGDSIEGGEGDDTIDGAGGNDYLRGLIGNDRLNGGMGRDTLEGGTGGDSYFVNVANDVVIEVANPPPAGAALEEFIDTVFAAVSYSLQNVANVENITLTGSAQQATGNTLDNEVRGNLQANTLNGLTGHDLIVGGSGEDTLLGGGGDDTLDGGEGNDSMVGGAGNDTYVIDSLTDVVSELAAAGSDTVRAKVTGYVLPSEVENLLLFSTVAAGTGNTKHNLITGNDAANTLSGGGGRDSLNGGLGNDTLIGGVGADSLVGGAGNDLLVWDANDVALEGGPGSDKLKLAGTTALDLMLVDNAKITGVERVMLGGTNTLKLNAQDLLDLSASTNTLVVDGGAEDSVDLVGVWTEGAVVGAYTIYTAVSDGITATLRLDMDVQVL